jgi:hypothetical protein
MTAQRASDSRGNIAGLLGRLCLVLAAVQLVILPLLWFTHDWIIDRAGLGIPTDFINVWAAGRMALGGHAAEAYDWAIQKQLEIATLGQSFEGIYAWHYPPPFLFVASALAMLPYAAAYMAWPVISFVPFACVMRGIVGRPFGWVLAAGFPALLANAMVGQNGCLTAALIGATLVLLPVRPILAGICLGLLSYKPQYGLLFPLVLVAALQWRVIVAAAVTVLAMAGISVVVFGVDAWLAFVHWLPIASHTFLDQGGMLIWGKMQSVYAATRYLGGSDQLGWTLQMMSGVATACAVVVLWRGRAPYTIKAAGLATGTLLATPYVFLYDMMVLAVAMGFLIRAGWQTGFHRFELPALAAAGGALLLFQLVMAPVGLLATILVAIVVARRAGWIGSRIVARLAPPTLTAASH